jgi:RNA polymerase sigma-70 factor (ECF subfamily)
LAERIAVRLADKWAAALTAPVDVASSTPTGEDWGDIRLTLRGDGDAYARLVRKYQGTISKQMWRFCRHETTCEELTQEVFVEAYVSLRRYRGDAPLVHWLRRIATRVGFRYYKRQDARRAEGTIALQEWDQEASALQSKDSSADIETAEAAAKVHTLLAMLPPRDRLVLTLIYLEECSVAEAAEMIGWSQTMVKVQAHRARKKLKKLCDQHGI